MTGPISTPRSDPRIIRDVLTYLEDHGPVITARKFNIDPSSVYRWLAYQRQVGRAWPTEHDIVDWDAKAGDRRLNAERKRRYEKRRYLNRGPILVDATGTIRKLRALCRLGWTQSEIGRELGVSAERISQFTRGRHKMLQPTTVRVVDAVYRQFSMKIPHGPHAAYARSMAEKKGWASPLAWDDETIDDPAAKPIGLRTRNSAPGTYIDETAVLRRIRGDRIYLTTAERAEVSKRLRAYGWSYAQIEERTGLKADRYAGVAA